MDSDDPDLEAFKSNLCLILRERELGKAAALVSNLCPNTSDPQSIGVSSKDSARRDSPCGTSSQSDSEDLPDDHETSSEWKFEGHIYFEAGRWPAGKTYEDAVRAAVEEQYLPTVPITWKFFQFGGRTRQGIVETAYTRLCKGKIGEPTTVEKLDRSSCVGVEKNPEGGIPLHKTYILDTQGKIDPRTPTDFC